MTVALAFAVFAASAAAQDPQAIKPFPVGIVCTKSAEKVSSGLSKICYYRCAWSGARNGANASALTAKSYEHCPDWVPRWRLTTTGNTDQAQIHARAEWLFFESSSRSILCLSMIVSENRHPRFRIMT
jgi:hypothetical protein